MKALLCLMFSVFLGVEGRACIWDADTLWHEKLRSHDLASAILGKPAEAEDSGKLRARIQDLETHRNEASADWWNNLAGAYLRLRQPALAIKLLEPIAAKFPDDYGIHANLGTAYHLLGRYADAEKEIARDMGINPEAHFGLEKYHLALLQYLVRNDEYKKHHFYVDEFSRAFAKDPGFRHIMAEGKLDPANTNALEAEEIASIMHGWSWSTLNRPDYTNDWEWKRIVELRSQGYAPPSYRFKWDLAADPNFEAGVLYMAQMNPSEPACYEMLGLAAVRKHDFHLAAAAYAKAVALGSLKSEVLQDKIGAINSYISESYQHEFFPFGLLSLLVVLFYIYTKIRDYRRRRRGGMKA